MMEKTMAAGQNAALETPRGLQMRSDTENSRKNPGAISFGDMVDVVNPLQHIPLVGHLYRGISGDEIGPGARFLGGGLYGGPIGAGGALVSLVAQAEIRQHSAGNAFHGGANTNAPDEKADMPVYNLSRAAAIARRDETQTNTQSLPDTALGFREDTTNPQDFSTPAYHAPGTAPDFVPDLYYRRSIY